MTSKRGFAALVTSALLLAASVVAAADEIDLNAATREEIRSLPIEEELADRIFEHREYVDFFEGPRDLLLVEGMTPAILAKLQPLIRTDRVEVPEAVQRKNDLFYRFEWWEGAEGRDESLVEFFKQRALDPVNVNTASLLDMQNLQSVSPVDAVAVVKYRKQVGEIGHRGALRRARGLSGWGYSNMRNFVTYEEPAEDRRLRGGYSLRVETTEYFPDAEDLLRDDRDPGEGTNNNWWDILGLDDPEPAIWNRLALRYGRRYEGGFVTSRRLGEDDLFDSKKGFVSIRDTQLGPVRLENLVLGNYVVSWGQGVVMENTDFFSSRKTGYNFGKRYDGVLGDFSRSELYSLRGVAAEATWGPFRGVGFLSNDDKDAILNDDGSVNLLIPLTPRVENDVLEANGLNPMRDVLEETTWGGNLRFEFKPGCHLGIGGYESRYNRFFDPKYDPTNPTDKHPLIADDDEDNFVAQDSELFSAFKSDGKFRRVFGADFQWVHRDLAVQGEYAELDNGGELLKLGDDPKALVLNAFVQKENLTFLTVFRNYDVAFDNPYQRSFSNYERYKGTILEDFFRLQDPIYGMAYENAAQPQAERGFYINTRYRWADPFISTIEWDTWRRQADGSKYSRFVGRLEYRLLFPLRFKLRHKWQNRESENLFDASIFNNVETIWELEYRLSRFNELEFRYGSAYTKWPPRGRLQGTPDPTGLSPVTGNNGQEGQLWSAKITHHSENRRIKIDGQVMVYDGFWWFFEKNTFRVTDGTGFRSWIEVTDRVSDAMTLRFRYVRDNQKGNSRDIRQFNEPVGDDVDAEIVKDITTYFRFQADYTF